MFYLLCDTFQFRDDHFHKIIFADEDRALVLVLVLAPPPALVLALVLAQPLALVVQEPGTAYRVNVQCLTCERVLENLHFLGAKV